MADIGSVAIERNRLPSRRARELAEMLSAFVRTLRRNGYIVTYESLTSATGIFLDEVARSPDDLSRLKYRLTPIFATTPESQRDIERRIDSFISGIPAETRAELNIERQGFRRARWIALSLAAAFVALIALIVYFTSLPPAPVEVKPSVRLDTTVRSAPSFDAEEYPEIPRAEGVQVQPRYVGILRSTVEDPLRRLVIALALTLPLLLALLWWTLRWLRRRHWNEMASLRIDAPEELTQEYRDDRIPISGALRRTGARLADATAGISGDLDVRSTIHATVRAAGFLTPKHEELGKSADYVVLVERRGPNDHLARVAEIILDRIEKTGVRIRRYYYRDDPRFCHPAGKERTLQPFSRLARDFGRHRFLVIGSGDGFFHPRTGKFLKWPEALDVFLSASLLSSRPRRDWTYREDQFRKLGFLVGTASPEGFASYSNAVTTGQDFRGGDAVPRRVLPVLSDDASDANTIAENTPPSSLSYNFEVARAMITISVYLGYMNGLAHIRELMPNIDRVIKSAENLVNTRDDPSRVARATDIVITVLTLLSWPLLLAILLLKKARGSLTDFWEQRTTIVASTARRTKNLATPGLVSVLVLAIAGIGTLVVERQFKIASQEVSGVQQPLESFRDGPEMPQMITLPGGEFIMGSPETEEGRDDDEGPTRLVTIAPFAIAATEVTFDQWQACVDGGGCQSNPDPSDEGWGRGTRPVINVSWDDAQEYIAWLNTQVEGSDPYRLPTEAEWEFAARAGTTTPFAFGETISTEQANYDGNIVFGLGWIGVFRGQTVPVEDLDAANAWGLLHMHGNVYEWVEDCWHHTYAGAPTDGSAWLSEQDGDCSRRVLRGGSWNGNPRNLRSAYRFWEEPEVRNGAIGFRPARTLITP